LIALVAVFPHALNAISYFRDYHSHTSVILASADAHVISLYAWNTGRKPSTLDKFEMTFGKALLPTNLVPMSRIQTVISPGGQVTLQLKIPPLQQTASEVITPKLTVGVMESNHDHVDKPITLPADFGGQVAERLKIEGQ
jgi:membrane protein YdbS with pleckstrin-like domain